MEKNVFIIVTIIILLSGIVNVYAYWNIEVVESNDASSRSVGKYTSLAIDSNNYPHISYIQERNSGVDALKYAHWDGVEWKIETIKTSTGFAGTSIVLDQGNNPHITTGGGGLGLTYYHWDGIQWQSTNVDFWGSNPSLSLDSKGYPHIVYNELCLVQYGPYYAWIPCAIKYIYWDGSNWQKKEFEYGHKIGYGPSLILDKNDNPHIVYFNSVNSYLWYRHYDGIEWKYNVIDYSGDWSPDTSIALDSNGYPHVAFCRNEPNISELRYFSYNGSEWNVEIVDSPGCEWYVSLAIDSRDRPHISYYQRSNKYLKYAFFSGSKWHVEIVDNNEDVGKYNSLTLDSFNRPHISYYDNTNNILKYAYKNICCHQYDQDCDWNIGDFELLDAIDEWAMGNLGDFELLDLIDYWAYGSYCWIVESGNCGYSQGIPNNYGACL